MCRAWGNGGTAELVGSSVRQFIPLLIVLYKCPLSASTLFIIVSFSFVNKKGTFDGHHYHPVWAEQVLHTSEASPESVNQLSAEWQRLFLGRYCVHTCTHMCTHLSTPERQKGPSQQIKWLFHAPKWWMSFTFFTSRSLGEGLLTEAKMTKKWTIKSSCVSENAPPFVDEGCGKQHPRRAAQPSGSAARLGTLLSELVS